MGDSQYISCRSEIPNPTQPTTHSIKTINLSTTNETNQQQNKISTNSKSLKKSLKIFNLCNVDCTNNENNTTSKVLPSCMKNKMNSNNNQISIMDMGTNHKSMSNTKSILVKKSSKQQANNNIQRTGSLTNRVPHPQVF